MPENKPRNNGFLVPAPIKKPNQKVEFIDGPTLVIHNNPFNRKKENEAAQVNDMFAET